LRGFAIASLGIAMLAGGLHGYFLRRCTTLEKAMLLAGAACVVYPSVATDLAGLGLGAAVLLIQRLRAAEA
jgi:TRAP-type uncharacterized transport system fused permease subunit